MAPVTAKAQSVPTSMCTKPAKPVGSSPAERRRPRIVRTPKELAQSHGNSRCLSVPLNAEMLIENTRLDFEDQFHACAHDLISGIWLKAYHNSLEDDPDTVQIYTDDDDDVNSDDTTGGVRSGFGMREIETTENANLAVWMERTCGQALDWSMMDAAWNEEEEDVTNEDEDVTNQDVDKESCVSASIDPAIVPSAQSASSTCVSQLIPKQHAHSGDTHITQEAVAVTMRLPAGSPLNALRAKRGIAQSRSASSPQITSVNAFPLSSPHVSASQASTNTIRSAAPLSAMAMDLDDCGATGLSFSAPHPVFDWPSNKKSKDTGHQVRPAMAMDAGVGWSLAELDLSATASPGSWTSTGDSFSKNVYSLKSAPKTSSRSASLGALKVVKSNGHVLPVPGQKQQTAEPIRRNIGSGRKDWLLVNAPACDAALVGAMTNKYQR